MRWAGVILAFCLAACDSGSSPPPPVSTPSPSPSASPTPTVASLEASGAIPTLDRSASLSGPDTNSNGVRDDVDAYISSGDHTPEQKAGLTKFAAGIQGSLSVDPLDRDATIGASRTVSRALNCVLVRFGANISAGAKAMSDIESITTNTRARLDAYLAYNKALEGSVVATAEGDTCE